MILDNKQDIRQFLDRLRRLLATKVEGQEAVLAEEIRKYSALCDESNVRLRECFALANKGQYANAVASSELEPNLLDRCSVLDFPERETLPEVAKAIGLSEPEFIDRRLVEALQEAYEKGANAAENLRTLRKLTLSRATIPARLVVMRRLLIQNPSHPFLESDIRQFELAWFKRVIDFSKPFATAGNAEVLQEVLDDLATSGYLETPTKSIIDSLKALLTKAHQIEIPLLAAKVRAAYDQKSVSSLSSAFAEWRELCAKCGIDPLDARFELREAAHWLRKSEETTRQRNEEQEAKAGLSRLIQKRNVSQSDLETSYAVARAHGVVDDLLESQYQSRLSELTRSRTTLRTSLIAGAITLVGAVSLISFLVIRSANHQKQVAALVSALEPLLSSRRFEEAIAKSDSAEPSVKAHPSVVAIVRTANEAKNNADALKKAIETIAACPITDDVSVLTAKALELAVTEEQRSEIRHVEQEWLQKKEVRTTELRTAFEAKVRAIDERLTSAESDHRLKWNAAKLKSLSTELFEGASSLRDEAMQNGLGDGSLPEVEKRISGLQNQIQIAERMTEFVIETTKKPLSETTITRISSFLHENPEIKSGTSSEDIDDATLSDLYRTQAALHSGALMDVSLSNRWFTTPLQSLVASANQEYTQRQSRSFVISSASTRENDSVSLRNRFRKPDIASLTCVRVTGFEVPYYTNDLIDPSDSGAISFQQIIDAKGNSLKRDVPATAARKIYPAPQSILSDLVESVLQDSPGEQWHKKIQKIYTMLRETESAGNVDPLLRLQLIDQTLSTASKASASFQQLFNERPGFKELVGCSDRINGKWLLPDEEGNAESARLKAAALCDSAPELSADDADQAGLRDNGLQKKLRDGLVILGLVDCSESLLKISLFPELEVSGAGTLYVVTGQKWIAIGKCEDAGTFQIDDSAAMYVGFPVVCLRDM